MDFQSITEIAAVILAALAAGTILIFSMSSWLGRAWANRLIKPRMEAQALKLRRGELLFDKQFEAASTLVALLRQFQPNFHHPSMSWQDACDEIACDFANIDTALGHYLARHGAVLPDGARALLGEAIGLTREHRFKISGPEVPASANKAAAVLYDRLWKAEAEMLKLIQG